MESHLESETVFFETIENNYSCDYMLRANDGVPFNGVYIRPHVHFEHEILWFNKARGEFSINNKKYDIADNTLIYVPPMVPHDMALRFTSDHDRYLLQYDNVLVNRLGLKLPFSKMPVGKAHTLSSCEAEKIQFLFNWLAELQQNDGITHFDDSLISLILTVSFDFLTKGDVCSDPDPKIFELGLMLSFILNIEETNNYNISLNSAAELCGKSINQFSKLFKSVTGMNLKEYCLRKKIQRSACLLRNSEMTVTDIAYDCEFTDSAYYCLKFREVTGVSPRDFRKRIRSTKQLSTKHDQNQ